MHQVVGVAFREVNCIFNLVQQVGGYEVGMLANEIIDVIFHHVFPVGIALAAHFVYFVANAASCGNDVAAAHFQIVRDFIPCGVGQNDGLVCAHVLVGLHVIDHAANVGIELFLNGTQHFVGEGQPFAQADLHQ